MVFLYVICCVGFASGLFVGEYKGKEIDKVNAILYFGWGALLAPMIFAALVGEWLVVQSNSRPTTALTPTNGERREFESDQA